MSIKTITRTTAILLALLFNTAWAQSFSEGVNAYNEGDYGTALEVFRSLAKEGSAEAQYNIGYMYEKGQGVPQADSIAVRWYRHASEQGNANAQFNLGVMYADGEGVLQDYSEALRWFRAAAEQGDAGAQNNLGAMYGNGNGVNQDQITAHMWFNIASANGSQKAREGRRIAAERMSREEIAEAQRRARACMESGYQDCD
ncbi:sel1 repeat family protein [Spiribacter aquaticus]|uniref:Sel1 repeat family protein n=1 Tax=Spiribacter aquaticus TaxID=1935996 RepID=A0A557RK55_9GAMM|nr:MULTISPECIES: tetratricopeptide repeat protein [Spiribacter]KAF0279935.1 hypothetical protein BA897_04145 [Spiribacter roseus]TVO65540.1 sel1 repeat family protein [Spiribacter aquaticus]